MEKSVPTDAKDAGHHPTDSDRMVYVVPPEYLLGQNYEPINLLEIGRALWKGKWLIIGFTFLAAAFAVLYLLLAQKWYRAEVVLISAEVKSAQMFSGPLAGLGGLASLAGIAGISVGGGNVAEPLAVLRSREFTRSFIEKQNLLPVLYAKEWDASTNHWKSNGTKAPPDIRDAVLLFDESIRDVREDKKNGLVIMAIEWTDPVAAANWANLMVERLNARMRQRALESAQANVKYLRDELNSTQIVTLQQSMARLLENEMQRLMLARGNEEFAFRFIDRAEVPKRVYRPRRIRSIAFSILLAGAIATFFVLLRHGLSRQRKSPSGGMKE